ncbi:MAG: peptidoglycan DD-metalloendopeptidase family protein [Pseudomonadota bacterium]
MIRAFCLLAVLVASTASAQTDPTITAARASAMLEAAAESMTAADGARDRVAALTETIRAYEEGLIAVREALRRLGTREMALRAALNAERDRLATLIGAAQAIERQPAPILLLHPTGPIGAARSSMIISDVAPALSAEIAEIRAQLIELQTIRTVQLQARADLSTALDGAQTARAALSQAIADRTDLPPRVDGDPVALRALLDAATSLDALASALADAPPGPLPEAARIDAARGTLPMPVFGEVLRSFGITDAAGIVRPGVIIATRPRALVTAPWPGTIRFAGTLPDFGQVILLEPDATHLIILAGMGDLFVTSDEFVMGGAPLALMDSTAQPSEELIVANVEDAGLTLSQTLYIEVRVRGEPVDPADWFRLTPDEE